MPQQITAKIKKLKSNAKLPEYKNYGDAGMDLFACIEEPVEINPHQTVKIGSGVSIAPPEGWFGAIYARSGLSTKEGLRPANCVGICDNKYRGEYIVPIHNDSEEVRTINPGDRIAQLIFREYPIVTFEEVDELDQTERGDGGFGSTGKQ